MGQYIYICNTSISYILICTYFTDNDISITLLSKPNLFPTNMTNIHIIHKFSRRMFRSVTIIETKRHDTL